MPLGIGDKDLERGLMASKYININKKGINMENKNTNVTTRDEHKPQNIFKELNLDKLDEIEADELGKNDIKSIVSHLKQTLNKVCDEYVKGEWNCYYHYTINFVELEELLKHRSEDREEIIEELSLLFIAMILYTLREHYKEKLLTDGRNDHHAFMYQAVNKFARKFYGDYMIEATEFAIADTCVLYDNINNLLYWLEFATAETDKRWII